MKIDRIGVTFLVVGVLILACMGFPGAAGASEYQVMVNGVLVDFGGQPPYEKEGRIMVPVRAPMEALGATVEWDGSSQSATLTRNGIIAVFTVGQTGYTVNGQLNTMDVAPEVVSERVAFPVRYCAEALGAVVNWSGSTSTVNISSEEPVVAAPPVAAEEDNDLRIQLLEKALAPETMEQAANDWARAISTRNGAWEYALLSDELRAEKLGDYTMSWVTGFSSPWVTDYSVEMLPALSSEAAGMAVYHVSFAWTTSAHDLAISEGDITVSSYDSGFGTSVWRVSDIAFDPFDMH